MISENLHDITLYLWHQSNKRITDLLLKHPDFNIGDYYYLTTIASMDHPNFGDVAEALNLTKPAVSALIKRLIKNDLIEKIQCTDDKRIFYLSLTEQGHKLIDGDQKIFDKVESIIKTKLNHEQMQSLDCILDVVVSVFK